jgi:pimeloyl-ACP methyl ester carboxylesterase
MDGLSVLLTGLPRLGGGNAQITTGVIVRVHPTLVRVMTTVDVGGYSVAVEVASGDDPPVVLVSSQGSPGSEWQPVRQLLATRPSVITYDRPALGASPARPAPNPPLPYSAFASELATMLDRLGVTDPVVAVGHSFGSLIVRMFAARQQARVAGMVHVDGSVPRLSLWPGSGSSTDGDGQDATGIDTVAGEAEMAGIVLPIVPGIVLARTPGRWGSPPPDPSIDGFWQDAQAALADQAGAELIIAIDSGHRMVREAPDLVAFAIDEVVRAVRDQRTAADLDPARVAAAGGRRP